jgi:hypothetical protein
MKGRLQQFGTLLSGPEVGAFDAKRLKRRNACILPHMQRIINGLATKSQD